MSLPDKPRFTQDPERTHSVYMQDILHNVGFFTEHPYRRLGDSDSAHGVLFGSLPPYGDVAIKPFATVVKAEQEKEVLDFAKAQGFETIEPITIASEGIFAYLISGYRPDLRHLGQVAWNENIASRRLKKVITPTLNFAAEVAGNLHASRITHGDLQPKNVMLNTEGTAVIGDVESGQIRLSGNELLRKGDKDIARFGSTVLWRGLLSDRSLRYRLGYLSDELIEPAVEIASLTSDYDRTKTIRELIAQETTTAIQRRQQFERMHTKDS